jgi:hypothetical protein
MRFLFDPLTSRLSRRGRKSCTGRRFPLEKAADIVGTFVNDLNRLSTDESVAPVVQLRITNYAM